MIIFTPSRAIRFLFFLSEVIRQLGHLIWMSLLTGILIYIHWPWQIALVVMGIELVVFSDHQMEHHATDGWLAMPGVIFAGVAMAVAGFYHFGFLPIIPVAMTASGSVVFSISLHRLQPAHRAGSVYENLAFMAMSLGLCAVPFFVDLAFY